MVSVVKYLLQHPGLMKKTYFYWTVRDYKAFEWFSQMLDDIYEKDAHGRLDIYHFLTSLKLDERDFGAVLLSHAAESKHKRTNFDILIGNRTRHQIEAGRPDWNKELRKIKRFASQELGLSNCGIFLCGPDAMAKDIYETTLEISAEQRRNKDDSFHFHFTKETF
jgi:NADPH oxidase 5